MNFPSSNLPVSMGQSCTLCFADSTKISGDLVYCDDTIVALDNVRNCMAADASLIGGRGVFPLSQIRWLMPEPDTHAHSS